MGNMPRCMKQHFLDSGNLQEFELQWRCHFGRLEEGMLLAKFSAKSLAVVEGSLGGHRQILEPGGQSSVNGTKLLHNNFLSRLKAWPKRRAASRTIQDLAAATCNQGE